MFNWLNNTYKFLKHYKVLVENEKIIREKKLTGHYKFQSLSQTRWCARSTNLTIAVNAYVLLIELCDVVTDDATKSFDGDLKLTAAGLRRKLCDPDFCLALLVMKDLFATCICRTVQSIFLRPSIPFRTSD